MRIVLSRKGFDGTYGGFPSVIDGNKLIPFYIPDFTSTISYPETNKKYFKLLNKIPKINGKVCESLTCHKDPDTELGLFGQCGATNGHLINNILCKYENNNGIRNINGEILFLFFGSYREIIKTAEGFKFDSKKQEKHIVWGYFQVDKVYELSDKNVFQSLLNNPAYHSHPHLANEYQQKSNNILFEATKELSFSNKYKGCGILSYDDDLNLTKDGCSKSIWKLPKCLHENDINITYNAKNWKLLDENFYEHKSASIGQEFIISESLEVENWVKNLILNHL